MYAFERDFWIKKFVCLKNFTNDGFAEQQIKGQQNSMNLVKKKSKNFTYISIIGNLNI